MKDKKRTDSSSTTEAEVNEVLDSMSPIHSAVDDISAMKYKWYCGLDDFDGLAMKAPNKMWS